MEIVNKLTPIAIPPKDHCGWYGLVIKPKYIPLWLAKIFKNHLRIYEGWLNANGSRRDWWIYPNGSNDRENNIEVKPIYWCSIKSYYEIEVVPNNSSNPWTWEVKDPNGKYKISK